MRKMTCEVYLSTKDVARQISKVHWLGSNQNRARNLADQTNDGRDAGHREKELKKIHYKLHGQEISSRLEMRPKRKPLSKAHALFSMAFLQWEETNPKSMLSTENSDKLFWVLWLQEILLKEMVLQRAGISNLMLLPQSEQSLVRPSRDH